MSEVQFSQRLSISRQCDKWCDRMGVKKTPYNIITAAVVLGLLDIVTGRQASPPLDLYEDYPKAKETS